MRRALAAGLLGLLGAAACGGSGGDDGAAFLGVYQVTAHVAAQGQGAPIACDTAGDPVATPAFVKLAVDEFFDDPSFIRLSECDDAAGAVCTETLTLFNPGGPGLVTESANSQIGGGFPCQLYYRKATATLAEPALRLELIEKYDGTDRPAAQCTVEAAEGLAGSADCQRIERYDATRVE